MPRYSIIHATADKVKAAGGANTREASTTRITFADLTPSQVEHLKADGYKVSIVRKTRAPISPPIPVSAEPRYTSDELLSTVGIEEMRNISSPPIYGAGEFIAILDTGMRETHNLIGGKVVYSKNFTSSPMRDGFNHGTGVAAIAHTVAPQSGILNMKVLDDQGNGTEEEAVLAIDDILALLESGSEYTPCVINLSLGSEDTIDPDNALRVACRIATERGIWILAAAGNGGPEPGTITCPACERYVGAVGSCGYEPFYVSSFSSRGPTREGLIKPDLVLFGEDIILASSESDTATRAGSGTSFSTPFGSGIVAAFHEGYRRQVQPTIDIPGVYPELGIWIPIEDMIDVYLQGFSVKPQGAPTSKDAAYGYGIPFGPLMAQAFQPGVASTSSIMSAMLMMAVMVPMAAMMKRI